MAISHPVQLMILRELLYHPHARFRDLNQSELSNDHFNFHLKRLLQLDYVVKGADHYQLTTKGLETAGRLDLDNLEVPLQPKLGIMLCIIRGKESDREILLEERLLDPNLGRIGFHTEKVRFAEKLEAAATRCLNLETGLQGKPLYRGTIRVIRNQDSLPVIDVLRICFLVKNPQGKLIEASKARKNYWVNIKSLTKISNLYSDFTSDLDNFLKNKYFYQERILEY
ncbi:MAG: hypothetical protein WCJ58_05835 [bacterium]